MRQAALYSPRPALLFSLLLLAILAGAAVLRLADLGNRLMHCDEANQAVRFGQLLERGQYDYNPEEHHGPTLYMFAWPIVRLAGAEKLTEVTEVQLRLLPALFGIVLVGLIWLLRDELGHAAALWAGVLTALSPAMVFYSRYYIQEMLLVCFTFAAIVALWRFIRAIGDRHKAATAGRAENGRDTRGATTGRGFMKGGGWLVLLAVAIGMMHATKETCVIALGAMAVAAVPTMWPLRKLGAKRLAFSGLAVLLTAVAVSALLFSSFGKHPSEVVESYTAYTHYVLRASGEGSAGPHDYPWHHYFQRFFWWHRDGGPIWTEAPIAALALVGLAAAAVGKGIKPQNLPMARFLGIYTVLMTLIYCAISYKTPWCGLGFLHGMILLAGIGAAVLVRVVPGYTLKGAAVALLAAATAHLGWQAYRASFVAYEHPGNPYVYAHTTDDVPVLAKRVAEIAAAHGDGKAMHVQVICEDDDHWPLPWYLREFTAVDWSPEIPAGRAAPLIITQPAKESALAEYLLIKQPPGERYLYVPVPPQPGHDAWLLRPHVPLRVYVRLDLWEKHVGQGSP